MDAMCEMSIVEPVLLTTTIKAFQLNTNLLQQLIIVCKGKTTLITHKKKLGNLIKNKSLPLSDRETITNLSTRKLNEDEQEYEAPFVKNVM